MRAKLSLLQLTSACPRFAVEIDAMKELEAGEVGTVHLAAQKDSNSSVQLSSGSGH